MLSAFLRDGVLGFKSGFDLMSTGLLPRGGDGRGVLSRAIISFMQKKKKIRTPRKMLKANTKIQKRLEELHAQIRSELAGRTLPDSAEVIRQAREERDKQIWESVQGNRSK